MKQLFMTLFFILILLPQPGHSAEITLDREELQSLFRELLVADSPWNQNDLDIDNFSSKPSQVTIPAGKLTYTVLNQIHPQYLGHKMLSVMINIDAVPQIKLKMQGTLDLYEDVVVTSHRLKQNSLINEEDLTLARRKITEFAHQLVPSINDAVGMKTARSLAGGTVLLSQYVKKQPLIKRGDMVTILVTSGSLKITTQGEARGKGAEGELVKVKNLASRRIITARVVDRGVVEVEF